MGQTYSVEAHFVFKNNDQTAFCTEFRKIVEELMHAHRACFDLTRGNTNDPFGCFQILTSKDAYDFTKCYAADFDGSYSWGDVIVTVITAIAHTLVKGSYVGIEDDEGYTRIEVEQDGGFIFRQDYDTVDEGLIDVFGSWTETASLVDIPSYASRFKEVMPNRVNDDESLEINNERYTEGSHFQWLCIRKPYTETGWMFRNGIIKKIVRGTSPQNPMVTIAGVSNFQNVEATCLLGQIV